MEVTKIFAERLASLREERGLTQQALADSLGVTRQSLSLYEKAERTINTELLVKIAKYFDVSTDYLLGLVKEPSTNPDIKSACKATGLQEPGVNQLKNIENQTKTKGLLDLIICDPSFATTVLTLDLLIIDVNNLQCQNSFLNEEVFDASCCPKYYELLSASYLVELSHRKLYNDVLNALTDDAWSRMENLFTFFRGTMLETGRPIKIMLAKEESDNGEHNPTP